jgi:galactokinase
MKTKLETLFRQTYTTSPEMMVRSPGRINLIGEHLDYNNGWVLPASINKAIFLAGGTRSDGMIEVYAADLEKKDRFSINKPQQKGSEPWTNYFRGIAEELYLSGHRIKGCNVVVMGDIPLGAGLSSSAAVECGFALLLKEMNGLNISRRDIALMGQRSENNFVGMNCGIMDQFACVFGQAEQVIRLDCRTLEYEYFPFHFPEIDIVLLDTGVKHSFGSGESEYNKRRRDCEAGVEILRQWFPDIQSLRDVSATDFEKHRSSLRGNILNRCSYVIAEISRVEAACRDLQAGDLDDFGKKMFQTHEGLQHLYEVSCKELDFLVGLAAEESGCLGARMMGGGFGGCTINLVRKSASASFISKATKSYQEAFGIPLKSYLISIEKGLDVI